MDFAENLLLSAPDTPNPQYAWEVKSLKRRKPTNAFKKSQFRL